MSASDQPIVHAPWTVREDHNNHWGMREVVGPAVSVVGFTVATNVPPDRAMQVESDVRLIAAAPELLAACGETIAYLASHADDDSNRLWGLVAAAYRRGLGVDD